MDCLPNECLLTILSFLPDEDLLIQMTTSKAFYRLILLLIRERISKFLNNCTLVELDLETLCLQKEEIVLSYLLKNVKFESQILTRCFFISCKRGDLRIARLLAKNSNLNFGLFHACNSNRKELAFFLLERGAKINYGLVGAAKGGHLSLLNLLIEMEAGNLGINHWNYVMYAACEGGHKEIAIEMIKRGANDFNRGLMQASHYNREELANLMREMLAQKYKQA